MNIFEKKLSEISKENLKGQEQIVNNAFLLLEQNANEERQVLKAIGLDNNIKSIEKKKEDLIIRTTQKEKYEGKDIVHIDEINKLLLKYRLYIKPANQYVGNIPNELGSELRRFCTNTKIPLVGDSSYSNFYVIAPPIMFKNYKKPIEVLRESIKDAQNKSYRPKFYPRSVSMDYDPILLYKIHSNEDYYVLIRSWGEDDTFTRSIYGFFTQERNLKVTSQIVRWFTGLCMMYLGVYIATICFTINTLASLGDLLIVVLGIASLLFGVIYGIIWLFDSTYRKIRKNIIENVTRNNPDSNDY